MNEYYAVCARKPQLARDPETLRKELEALHAFCTAPLDTTTHFMAQDLRETTNYSWWDCLALASALASGCGIFLSEDLDHGRTLGVPNSQGQICKHQDVSTGLTILSPFQSAPDDALR